MLINPFPTKTVFNKPGVNEALGANRTHHYMLFLHLLKPSIGQVYSIFSARGA